MNERIRQQVGAVIILLAAVGLALGRVWPFDAKPIPLGEDPSVWQIILSDRVTLGFLRLSLIALGAFVAMSVVALAIAGRWLKGFGKEGLTADDASKAEKSIEDLEDQVRELTDERDQALEETQTMRRLLALLTGGSPDAPTAS